jgi:hypothetical protein
MKNLKRSIQSLSLIIAVQLFASLSAHAVDSVPVHSIMPQTYVLNFSGKVHSGAKLCKGAKVVVDLNTSLDQGVQASTIVRDDGTYSLKVMLDEDSNVSLNWKVSARGTDGQEAAIEGSRILNSDNVISMEKSLNLSGQILQLALR